MQAAVGEQFQHQFVQLTDVRHKALQTLAAGLRQVFREGQGQAEIQAGQRRTQFVRDGIEQVALLVEQALDIVGHGVEYRGQAADVGAGRNVRTLGQIAPAQLDGGGLQALQVAPMRAQPEQQARQQRSTDQYVHRPVQQVHVQRVRRDGQLDHKLVVHR